LAYPHIHGFVINNINPLSVIQGLAKHYKRWQIGSDNQQGQEIK
jgi:hypothetical protein